MLLYLQLDSLFRISMQAVRTVPDSVMNSVDGMVDNLSKVLQVRTTSKEGSETVKVGSSIDAEVIYIYPIKTTSQRYFDVLFEKANVTLTLSDGR